MKLFAVQTLTLSVVAITALALAGCGSQADGDSAEDVEASHEDAHDHGGWWCVEHAVPEAECSICSEKAAEEFKAKGDWCEEHNRAESQCFICDPSRAEKYAKLYEAKVGEKPPEATE